MLYGTLQLSDIIRQRLQFNTEERVSILRALCESIKNYHDKNQIIAYCPPQKIELKIENEGINCHLLQRPISAGRDIAAGTLKTLDMKEYSFIFYEAPESLLTRVKANPGLDVYWCSAMAYQMFTGNKIRNGSTAKDILRCAISQSVPSDWQDTPVWLQEILKQALFDLPEKRPAMKRIIAVLAQAGGAKVVADSVPQKEVANDRPDNPVPSSPQELKSIGQYGIVSLIHRGRTASVYSANRDGTQAARFAIKYAEDSDPPTIAAFLREANILFSISSPFLPNLIDFGFHGNRPYLVFDYIHGSTLHDHMKQRLRIPDLEFEACKIIFSISLVLHELHEFGCMHRDISPSNILIDEKNERAILIDLGISSRYGEKDIKLHRKIKRKIEQNNVESYTKIVNEKTSGISGTPSYMAPEQDSLGAVPLPAQDIFSLGIVAFEVAFGEEREALSRIADTQIPGLIKRMCQPDPSKRPVVDEVIKQASSLVGARVGIPTFMRAMQGLAVAVGLGVDVGTAGASVGSGTVTGLSIAMFLQDKARASRMKLTFPPLSDPLPPNIG